MITNNIVDLIGNTPLIKLKYPSEITNCEIYGKAEFLNAGGSIKDRTALGIILDAEKNKLIENILQNQQKYVGEELKIEFMHTTQTDGFSYQTLLYAELLEK